MATEALKSDLITNATATTQTLNSPRNVGKQTFVRGVVTAHASADVGSTYRMVRVPSNAVITSVLIRTDGGGSGAVHVGVCEASNTSTIGTVKDADLFKAAQDIGTAITTGTELLLGNVITHATINEPLWYHAGYSADPKTPLEIYLTTSTDLSGADNVLALDVTYLAG